MVFRNGITKIIENPADFPDPGGMLKIEQVLEPIVHATIVAPEQSVSLLPIARRQFLILNFFVKTDTPDQ